MAPAVAIAEGWSRPADIGRSAIFYDGTLNPDTYPKWLDDNAIAYVAISQGPYDVQANQWHFFRHVLHDARPAYTPEERIATSRRDRSRARQPG